MTPIPIDDQTFRIYEQFLYFKWNFISSLKCRLLFAHGSGNL